MKLIGKLDSDHTHVDATTTAKGIVELATTAETTTGTDTDRAVTPDGLKDGYQGSTNVTTLGTITTGLWQGDAITTTYLEGQSGTNTGDETQSTINDLGITNVGVITGGTWQGTAIASAYLDADTAHLSGVQTFTGEKTFDKLARAVFDGNKSVTPGDGAMIHVDTCTITDSATSEGGTADLYTHVKLEGPTLAATNASVTTTDAATLYVMRLATGGTNQTISNNWGVYVEGPTRTESITNVGDYTQTTGDMTLYDATNNGNPTISLGSSATERLEIKAEYESGAQGLDVVKFISHTAGSSANDARFSFNVDETFIFNILDNGIRIKASGGLEIGTGNTILSDSSGTTTLSNIDAIDATTESTIETAIDTLSNLTTVGTIGTGVWEGTAIATGHTKHLQHFDFQGYGTGDGTNWEISKQVSVNTAPFNHDTSIGSDGLTAMSVQTWMRGGGKVMPKACTLKRITGWSTCAGSATANIGLFKFTPTRNSNINRSAVELADISYTALGNTKMEDHDITSFTADDIAAGDILFSALKSDSGAIQYFSITIEVEF